MSTIRDYLVNDMKFSPFGDLDVICAWLGIDADADKDSILVLERPKCPTCDGFGWVSGARPDARCPTCDGTGYVPDPWATVDGCLDWLRERKALVYFAPNQPANDGGAWVKYVGPSGEWEFSRDDDFHAALIAACRDVQAATP